MSNLWIFVFLWYGQIHATGTLLDKEECIEMLRTNPNPVVCISADTPRKRIYKEDIEKE